MGVYLWIQVRALTEMSTRTYWNEYDALTAMIQLEWMNQIEV